MRKVKVIFKDVDISKIVLEEKIFNVKEVRLVKNSEGKWVKVKSKSED